MNATDDKEKRRHPRMRTVLLYIAVILVLALLAAVGPMIVTTDGTENYSGVRRDAALNALKADRANYSPALTGLLTKARVDSVEPSPQGKDIHGNPLRCTDDPSIMQYYSVAIRRIGLFGATYVEQEYRICKTAG